MSAATGLGDVKDVWYSVVKKHHRHKWLRQERLLWITPTHVHNCRPSERGETSPRITKQFPLTSITTLGIKGEKYFYFHVSGDHTYHYYSPRAIEIALKIHLYVTSAIAVDTFFDAGDGRKTCLMDRLISGSVPLLRSQREGGGGSFTHHSPRLVRLRCKVNQALLNGEVDGSDELRTLIQLWEKKSEADDMDLVQLRRLLSGIKERCTRHTLERLGTSYRALLYEEVSMCVEDVLQRIVIQPNFHKIMSFLRRDPVLAEREARFNQQREVLRGRSAQIFNIPKDLCSVNYKAVLQQFDLLTSFRSPNDILDQAANIAACVYLSVYVTMNFSRKDSVHDDTTSIRTDTASQGAPLLQSKNAPDKRTSHVSSTRSEYLKVDHGCYKNGDGEIPGVLMLLLQPTEASAKTRRAAGLCALIALTPSGERSPRPRLRQSMNRLDRLNEKAVMTAEKVVRDTGTDNDNGVMSATQPFSNPELVDRVSQGGFSADEILPLFIHLVCNTDVPDLCIIVRFVELLCDPDDNSERAYYFTSIAAAILMVCDWKE